MTWNQIALIIIGAMIGAIIGFLSSELRECRRRKRQNKERRERGVRLFSAVLIEVIQGINRCQGLVEKLEEDESKISFSRIYTKFFDSMIIEIVQCVEDLEALRLLHRIYYHFDLVNFNMERDRFGPGAAFAKEYINEMKENYNCLESKLKEFKRS